VSTPSCETCFKTKTLRMTSASPLSKLPKSTDTILFLIAQELKIYKFFGSLHDVGIEDCFFKPHLDSLILSQMGLDDEQDETIEFYCRVFEKRSKKIKMTRESIMKQSLKVYTALLAEKKRRK
jgi:hypothetical protein